MAEMTRTQNDSTPSPSPRRIMELATAYWPSMVLLTLNELGICTRLAQGPATVEELAADRGLDPRACRFLLDAAVELRFLVLEGEQYRNGPEAETFLVQGRPAFLGGGLAYSLDVYEAWGQLPQAIRTGRPRLEAESYLGEDPERTRRFVQAMHHRALATARSVADSIDLGGRRQLLDLGGGSGVFSMLLCQRTPGLHATLFDLPGVVAVAAELLREAGVDPPVRIRPGDFHRDDLGQGFDVILINGVLHREPDAFCRDLVRRAFQALVPGGMIILGDVMLNETGHGPLFPLLFALNMLLTAPGGGAHSVVAHTDWLAAAGFVELRVQPLPPPSLHTLVFGTRPEE